MFRYRQSSDTFVLGFHISSPAKPGKYSYLKKEKKHTHEKDEIKIDIEPIKSDIHRAIVVG